MIQFYYMQYEEETKNQHARSAKSSKRINISELLNMIIIRVSGNKKRNKDCYIHCELQNYRLFVHSVVHVYGKSKNHNA